MTERDRCAIPEASDENAVDPSPTPTKKKPYPGPPKLTLLGSVRDLTAIAAILAGIGKPIHEPK
jgi:hypothetical protein